MSDYLDIVYNKKARPLTQYPAKLVKHLVERFDLRPGMTLVELGCGRGEFLEEFRKLGLVTIGVDKSPKACSESKESKFLQIDLEGSEDWSSIIGQVDVVYTKSVLEHCRDPERFFANAYELLAPEGLMLHLVPDWEANYKIYFDDWTHVSPFTVVALRDLFKTQSFAKTEAFKFMQLPCTWRYRFLFPFFKILGKFCPHRSSVKILRWSKELMLLGWGRKGS